MYKIMFQNKNNKKKYFCKCAKEKNINLVFNFLFVRKVKFLPFQFLKICVKYFNRWRWWNEMKWNEKLTWNVQVWESNG